MNMPQSHQREMNAGSQPRRALWKRAGTLVGAGMLGLATLALQPIPASVLQAKPELAATPPWMLQLMGLLTPTVLLVLAALCGGLVAHRVGLRSVLAGTASAEGARRGWGLAAALGLVTGGVLVWLDGMAAPLLGPPWEQFLRQASQPTPQALWLGVLYGGITEEILMRWGLMSGLAWAVWMLCGKRRPGPALVVAAAVTALAFGGGHLPALAAQLELTPAIVVRTLVVNAMAALVYAWVFWRHHLEAAMLSHACSHLAMGALWAML